jgi:hypothetical protein
MLKKTFTALIVIASLATAVLAQEPVTFTTRVTFEKGGKVLSKPTIRQVDSTEGSIEVEIETGKSIGIELVPKLDKVTATIEYQGKVAKFVLRTGEVNTIVFLEDGYQIKDKSGKIVQEAKLKGFPTMGLKGISVAVDCKQDKN